MQHAGTRLRLSTHKQGRGPHLGRLCKGTPRGSRTCAAWPRWLRTGPPGSWMRYLHQRRGSHFVGREQCRMWPRNVLLHVARPCTPPSPPCGSCVSPADSTRAALLACHRRQLSAAGAWPFSAAACRAATSAGAAATCQTQVGSGEPAARDSMAPRTCTQARGRMVRHQAGSR